MAKYGKKTWLDFVNKAPDNPKYYPAWNLTLSDDASQVNQQLTDTSVQNLPKIIAGKPADFDAELADLRRLHPQDQRQGVRGRSQRWHQGPSGQLVTVCEQSWWGACAPHHDAFSITTHCS
jgi:hypothetical protein